MNGEGENKELNSTEPAGEIKNPTAGEAVSQNADGVGSAPEKEKSAVGAASDPEESPGGMKDLASSEESAEDGDEAKEEKEESLLGNIIASVLLIAAIGFVTYIMICTAKGKAVSLFGKSILKVVTGSMEPTINVGDFIIIEETDASELKVNDIIAFYSEDPQIKDKLVTHRIVGIDEEGKFIMKGDANNIDDKYHVPSERILGKYVNRARFFKWVGSFTDRKKLLLLLVIIPILLISLYEVRSMGKLMKTAIKEENEKRKEEQELAEAERARKIEELKEQALKEYLASQTAVSEKPAETDDSGASLNEKPAETEDNGASVNEKEN